MTRRQIEQLLQEALSVHRECGKNVDEVEYYSKLLYSCQEWQSDIRELELNSPGAIGK